MEKASGGNFARTARKTAEDEGRGGLGNDAQYTPCPDRTLGLGQWFLWESMPDHDKGTNRTTGDEYRAVGEVRPIRMPVFVIEDKLLAAGLALAQRTANTADRRRIGHCPKEQLDRILASELFQTISAGLFKRFIHPEDPSICIGDGH